MQPEQFGSSRGEIELYFVVPEGGDVDEVIREVGGVAKRHAIEMATRDVGRPPSRRDRFRGRRESDDD